jgi:nucleotide-binding universal stress UspA family protein
MPQHILVTLDGSPLAEQALPYAAALARMYGARLTLARVPETLVVPVASAGVWITREAEPHEAREQAAAYLAELAARPALADLAPDSLLPGHPVVAGLLEAIHQTGADLVVLTTHGLSGVTRLLLGSVASKLVQQSPANVLVVPALEDEDEDQAAEDEAVVAQARPGADTSVDGLAWEPVFDTLVVPLDGSANAEDALPVAGELARRSGAQLRLVRVPIVPAYLTLLPDTAAMIPSHLQQKALEAESYLARVVPDVAAEGLEVSGDVEVALERGVERAIVTYADQHDADLILLTSHGHSGLTRLVMGSVADRVIRLASCPTWVVRTRG